MPKPTGTRLPSKPPPPPEPPKEQVTPLPGVDESLWEEGGWTTNLAYGKPAKLTGLTMGQWGLYHDEKDELRKWELWHVPTGRCAGGFTEKLDAMIVAHYLTEEYFMVFSPTVPEELWAECPYWIRLWLGAMDRAATYLDPFPQKSAWDGSLCKDHLHPEGGVLYEQS